MTPPLKLIAPCSGAPFIVWPVARREFYLAIQFALLPALLWAICIFGWRVFAMLLCAEIAGSIAHVLLKKLTRGGKGLLYSHTTSSIVILVALCDPMWPTWIVSIAAALIPIAFWLIGGTGRERIHVAVACAILLQLLVTYSLHQSSGDFSDAMLARDRLVMGDIRNAKEAPLYHWPTSSELSGDDAVRVNRPQQVAYDALDEISRTLSSAELRPDSGDRTHILTLPTRVKLQTFLDSVLSSKLPAIELVIAGVVPGRLGTISVPLLILGGLYLAYRYILRPRSVILFLVTYILGMALFLYWPTTIAHLGLFGLWGATKSMVGELLTLLEYAFFNSDILFASIFILALPGTQPLTSRGRRVFLITAALLAALLDRLNAGNLPAATAALCFLMPAAPAFDRLFAKKSWLTRVF